MVIKTDGKSVETSTDDEGYFEIPGKDFEMEIIFKYIDDKEYFYIYAGKDADEPLKLVLPVENGKIKEMQVFAFGGKAKLDDSGLEDVKDLNFEQCRHVGGEMSSSICRYIHLTEALEFYRALGVKFDNPVNVYTFVSTPKKGFYYYKDHTIGIDGKWSYIKNEWRPFLDYHEFSHYAMHSLYGKAFEDVAETELNHGGYANPRTGDSFQEGFAAFMPTVIANHYGRWWAGAGEKGASLYPITAGGLEMNYMAWDCQGVAEEFAIAGILWDLLDGNEEAKVDARAGIEKGGRILFNAADIDGNGKVSGTELFTRIFMDSFATNDKWTGDEEGYPSYSNFLNEIDIVKFTGAFFMKNIDATKVTGELSKYDLDSNGKLDRDEVVKYTKTQGNTIGWEEHLEVIFDVYDRDRNGLLDGFEIRYFEWGEDLKKKHLGRL